VNHFSNLGLLSKKEGDVGIHLRERVMVIGEEWRQTFASLTQKNKGQILPLYPWTIKSTTKDYTDFATFFVDGVVVENLALLSA